MLPSPYPAAGEVIDGKYQLERVLGEGGMGCVARAYHLLLRAPVALKFMNPQFMTFPGAVERFINEGIASKKIKSDHVVPVDDVGKLPSGAPYLVMPCLEGMDLADLLARDGIPGLPTHRAVHFTLQILRGLQAAHAAAIIHRDMKPSNCFVVKHDGEDDFVRILDFGISKVVEPGSASLTQTNSALGTPLYMSPEQARSPRDVDGRSDIYSVGVILYELLTGHTPFFSESGEFTEILFKLFTADPPPVQSTRPDIPDALAAVVHKALARETKDRYTTAGDLAEALFVFADARSAGIITRIRAFKPEQAQTMPPPADMLPMPASMVAFSALDARPATDLMAHRPTTDVMRGPPVTHLMQGAPGAVVGVQAQSEGRILAASERRLSVTPAGHPPAEGTAHTVFEPSKGSMHRVGASTDLGAARDQVPPSPQKRSPLVYGIPAAAVLAMIGIAAIALSKPSTPKADPSANVATAPPPTSTLGTTASTASNVTLPPTSTAPSATISATSSANPTPSASHRVITPPTTSTTVKQPSSSSGNVLDTPLHP